ncbi:Sec-independent protein translocase subunit TatA [Cellulomonas sp.]|jgi:sec-independent protein translocase protein TatA|uniref:Sec-independent protein translocase subunit TatA n=1 Tax=Cellulomonas sp. TaxID=40001 RepID=UPI002D5ED9CD|nr:Sec-independent protein translocase subunit TatA [Cellulomonas sp.]HYQ74000.1 Sec-independent protein translocase subunit TatA [Cellulomonas sp.]
MNALKPWHIGVLLVVILLLFGARRLPDLAKSVGESLRIFKREVKDLAEDEPRTAPAPPPTADPAPPLAQGPVVNPAPSASPAPSLDQPGHQPPASGSTTPSA